MSRTHRRRAPRAPFVVTVTVAAATAAMAAACGGQAFVEGGNGAQGGANGGAGGAGGGAGGAGGSSAGGSTAGVGGGSAGSGGAGCPTSMPAYGTACAIEGQACSYPSGPCCPDIQAICSGHQWVMSGATCNPPPPLPCPATPPVSGSACGPYPCSGEPYCTWGTCLDGGPAVAARCDGSIWYVEQRCGAVDGGTSDCSIEIENVVGYAQANKGCVTNADCMSVSGYCSEGADYCDGTFYVNQTFFDMAKWQGLTNALMACYSQNGFGCVVCEGMAPPPACIAGICQNSLNQ